MCVKWVCGFTCGWFLNHGIFNNKYELIVLIVIIICVIGSKSHYTCNLSTITLSHTCIAFYISIKMFSKHIYRGLKVEWDFGFVGILNWYNLIYHDPKKTD